MSDILCSFPGKYGDILWSLPTAREISRLHGQSVDFAVMPYYQSLLPLLAEQNYIEHAFIIEDWFRTHSNHGDGPSNPPEHVNSAYKHVYPLGFKGHPGITAPEMPLINFVAFQHGIKLREPVLPFIDVNGETEELAKVIQLHGGPFMKVVKEKRLVSYAFNEQYAQYKTEFFETVWGKCRDVEFFNVTTVPWKEAAWIIKNSLVYLGDRSANWVIANGVDAEIITFEPHPARHAKGFLGRVFGCPSGKEAALPMVPPRQAGEMAIKMIEAKVGIRREDKEVVAGQQKLVVAETVSSPANMETATW